MSNNTDQSRVGHLIQRLGVWGDINSLEALRRLVRDDGYAASFQNLAQYRDALLQHLKKWAVAQAAQQAIVRTWRQRINASPDFPLHAPNDVERAMVAEIADLRAALAHQPALEQGKPVAWAVVVGENMQNTIHITVHEEEAQGEYEASTAGGFESVYNLVPLYAAVILMSEGGERG